MQYPNRGGRRANARAWDAARVRALRRHLGLTQQELAGELGMRQQTVSEWETEIYRPRGASLRLLSLIAERAGFAYEAAPREDADAGSNTDRQSPAGG
ncbi:MAG TPA: helix-turn-helix domain-containing protein [Steroidobacteraceae bacterium]|nr:helix-turn-helix domain-containing protein [Steroidobacteraceae bacterium]